MLIFAFTIILLYGLSVMARGLAVACCVGLYAAFVGLLQKDKVRAKEAFSMLLDIATA